MFKLILYISITLVLSTISTGTSFPEKPLREIDFLGQLVMNHPSCFIRSFQAHLIERRINTTTLIKTQLINESVNLHTLKGQIGFVDAIISTFRYLHKFFDNSAAPVKDNTFRAKLGHDLLDQYQQAIKRFHDEFLKKNPSIVTVDYDHPAYLNRKLKAVHLSRSPTDNFNKIVKRTLLLIDEYKRDMDYIISDLNLQSSACNSNYTVGFYQTETEKLASFCSKSLVTLRDEILYNQRNGSLSRATLSTLLMRFTSIVAVIGV